VKFEDLVQAFRDRPFFESGEVRMLFGEPAPQTQARLSRWVSKGRLIRLRRSKYLLPPEHRRREPSLYYISNYLYRPSYVSVYSALEFHGLIPEAVGVVQAATTRHGHAWETPAGRFHYHALKQDRFWGYRDYSSGPVPSVQERFLAATPEKAVVDLFYLYPGEWAGQRLQEMRFQNVDQLDSEILLQSARRFGSPKVTRAVRRLLDMITVGEVG
jgi:predicted transcriptional regulator of viral defense system